MKLYHGTTGAVARKAIAGQGIQPRRLSKRSNWTNCPSHPDAVYLTNAYPLYFAAQHNVEVAAVVEVETDRLNPFQLLPDEDALEQNGRGNDGLPGHWTMRQRTVNYRNRLRNFADGSNWEKSLDCLGTCAHLGVIPPAAITRVAFIHTKDAIALVWEGMQPMISLLNFRYCGDRYKALTASIWTEAREGVTIQEVNP